MTFYNVLTELQSRWKLVAFFIVLVAGATNVLVSRENRLEAAEKKGNDNREAIKVLSEEVRQTTRAVSELSSAVKSLDGNLALILQLYGIDTSKINRWKRISNTPPVDSTGAFIPYREWLDLGMAPEVGLLWRTQVDSSGMIVAENRVLWDLRKK